MPTNELSDQDKKFKALALKQRMELEKDLGNFAKALDELFQIAPQMALDPTEKNELDRLSAEIRSAAASNRTRARILELLGKALEGPIWPFRK